MFKRETKLAFNQNKYVLHTAHGWNKNARIRMFSYSENRFAKMIGFAVGFFMASKIVKDKHLNVTLGSATGVNMNDPHMAGWYGRVDSSGNLHDETFRGTVRDGK